MVALVGEVVENRIDRPRDGDEDECGRWLKVSDGRALLDVLIPAKKVRYAGGSAIGQVIRVRGFRASRQSASAWYLQAEGVDVLEPKGPLAAGRVNTKNALLDAGILKRGQIASFKKSSGSNVSWPPLTKAIVLTSKTKGWGDFENQCFGRPDEVVVEPRWVRTQGAGAAAEIAAQLDRLTPADADLVFIVRGGGGPLDLAIYDDLDLALAIARCKVHVVTAVGHREDVHWADHVAGTALDTPTAAGRALKAHAWKTRNEERRTTRKVAQEREKNLAAAHRQHAQKAAIDQAVAAVRWQYEELQRFTDATLLAYAESRVKTRYRLIAAGLWLAALVALAMPARTLPSVLICVAIAAALVTAGVITWMAPRQGQRSPGKRLRRRLPTTGQEWTQRAQQASTVSELRVLRHHRP